MKNLLFLLLSVFTLSLGVQAQKYQLDKENSSLSFSIKNLGLKVKGTIKEFDCSVQLNNEDPLRSVFTGAAYVESIDTENEKRDNHLMKKDFFEQKKYPQLKIETKKIRISEKGYFARVDLTIKDVTKEIEIPFELLKNKSNNQLTLTAEFTIDRLEYHIGKSSLMMGDEVTVFINFTFY